MTKQELNLNLIDIADAIPGGFFIYRADGDEALLFVNNELLHLYQCDSLESFQELTGGTFRGMVHPDDLENIEESIAEQIQANSRSMDYVEYRIVCRDGSIRWVEDFGHLIQHPQYGRIFCVFVSEITETKQKLKDTRKLTRVIRDTYQKSIIADAHCYFEANITQNRLGENALRSYSGKNIPLTEVVGISKDGTYTEYIRAWAEKMMEKSADRERFLYHANPQNLIHLMESGISTDSVRFWTRNVLGERMYVHQHYEIAKDERTGDVHILSVVWDETPAKKQQELVELALAQAEAGNAAKSRFLASMSHDIRNPLNAIIGYATMAQNKPEQTEKLLKYHKKILEASKHLLSVLNDILDMQSIESGKLRLEVSQVNMADVLHEVRSLIQSELQKKKLDFFIDVSEIKHQYLICDHKRVTQILVNLLSNGIKYTPNGGAVSLKLRELPGAIPERPEYQFSVKDTGIGMASDFIERAFEPFEREQNGDPSIDGTGLGLAITKNIVELMGGTIRLKSQKNHGTTVTVTLPLRSVEISNVDYNEAELTNRHVLVIDDDYAACDSVTDMLIKLGARADWSMSGGEAVIRARIAAKHKDPFDFFIIDWQMPDMDGVEIAKQLREVAGDRAPVVMLTAYDWSEIKNEAQEAGVDGFLAKPLFEAELRQGIQKALHPELGSKVSEALRYEALFGKRILLVEDNEINQEIACDLLEHAGFRMEVANNGAEAIEMLLNNHPKYYDLILMDIRMPVMDGYIATQRIRAMENPVLSHIPIVALSANALKEDKVHALSVGMNEHLAKPINMEQVLKVLNEILG